MRNKIKNIIVICLAALIVSLAIFLKNEQVATSFSHVQQIEKSAICVYLVAGHGNVYNGAYLTPGKQSPTWRDGLKVYEGKSNKELTYKLAYELSRKDIDVTIINNLNFDMSLQERVAKINSLYSTDNRGIAIFLHHNAQPTTNADYTDFEGLKGYYNNGATGIESFTSVGQTTSDIINNQFIIPELEKELPGMNFRYGKGTKGKEANFYVLTYTHCPAVLIEFGFMTTYSECVIIADECYRDIYVQALANAIKKYNEYLNNLKY